MRSMDFDARKAATIREASCTSKLLSDCPNLCYFQLSRLPKGDSRDSFRNQAIAHMEANRGRRDIL
jgi:hypothetical protein